MAGFFSDKCVIDRAQAAAVFALGQKEIPQAPVSCALLELVEDFFLAWRLLPASAGVDFVVVFGLPAYELCFFWFGNRKQRSCSLLHVSL